MSNAEHIVGTLLETVEKWDKAHASLRALWPKLKKREALQQELARSIEYERALAKAGLKREDVSHSIHGNQIGATHNYKRTMPAKKCTDGYCRMRLKYLPAKATICPECQGPLEAIMRPISPSDLRGGFASHIVGVETNDGRNVFFDQPLSRTPWMDWDEEAEKSQKPMSHES